MMHEGGPGAGTARSDAPGVPDPTLARGEPARPQHRVVLAILDGWGLSHRRDGNAVEAAQTPNMIRYLNEYPCACLSASGNAIGLPDGQMGNSEVGHLNLGAGRTVLQEFLRINKAIETGAFFKNPALASLIERTRERRGHLQVLGLLSDGGVHSHIDHILALVRAARFRDVRISVHAFLDGRDTLPRCAEGYLARTERALEGVGRISSVSGRYYAMDRDNRWERTKMAYDTLVWTGQVKSASALEALRAAYSSGEGDEFVTPTFITGGRPIREEDGVVFMNFRPDRARQLTSALTAPAFKEFDTGPRPKLDMVTLVSYGAYDLPVAFPSEMVEGGLGEHVSRLGLRQLRAAETEKYAHVTYFFSGGREAEFPGERRMLVPSPKVLTYDLKPEMSAWPLTNGVLHHLYGGEFDLVIMNYANLDMVGHTGDMQAAVKAVETVDRCLSRLEEGCEANGYTLVLTADHGNAEQMIDPKAGGPFTAHTTNPVPFVICDKAIQLENGGILGDVAPTLLAYMGLPIPSQMTGRILVRSRSRQPSSE